MHSDLVEFACGGKFRVRGSFIAQARELVRSRFGASDPRMLLTARTMGRSNSTGVLWVEVTRMPDMGNSVIMDLRQLEPADDEARASIAQLNILHMETP